MKLEWCCRNLVVAGLYYTVCSTPKLFEQALRRMRIDKKDWPPFISNEQSDATCWEFACGGKTCRVVCIRRWEGKDPCEVVGLLVHEAVHIWQDFRHSIDETSPSSEFEAYSIQAIAQELLFEFRRQVTA